LHELVDVAINRREHTLDVVLAEFAEPDRDHHQHHAGRRDAIELVGRVVDDRQRLECADLELRHRLFEHALPPLLHHVTTPTEQREIHISATPSAATPAAISTASAASSGTSPLFHRSRITTAITWLPGPASRIAIDRSRMVCRNT